MPIDTLGLIGEQLKTQAHHATSWSELGLEFDQDLADQVISASPEQLIRVPYEDQFQREAKAISETCRDLARKLAQPLFDHLFSGPEHEEARQNWELFAVNYYDTGNVFAKHRDFTAPSEYTVAVISLNGIRSLSIDGYHPIRQEAGSIVLLDGLANPWHQARCIEGPSVSVVAEAPGLLYPV